MKTYRGSKGILRASVVGMVVLSSATAWGQTGSLGGSVWNDLNGNGVRDGGEPGLGGQQVELIDFDGDVVGSTATDGDGNFLFEGRPFGPYVVREVVPDGWRQTSPTFNTEIHVTPVSGAWDYDDDDADGAVGPEHWVSVAPDAGGNFQTPIDITGVAPTDLSPYLSVHYPGTGLHEAIVRGSFGRAFNVEGEYESDNGNFVEVGGQRFDLVQFHFHRDSEHAIDGALKDMEMHLVHRNANGGLTVLGLLIEEGEENEQLAEFFEAVEQVGSGIGDSEEIEHDVDLDALIPDDLSGWFYSGGLTTPPATEGVNWFVFEHALEMSAAQIEVFEDFLESIDIERNNRPIQPTNGRQLNQLNFQVTLNDEAGISGLEFGVVTPEPGEAWLLLVSGAGVYNGCWRRKRSTKA